MRKTKQIRQLAKFRKYAVRIIVPILIIYAFFVSLILKFYGKDQYLINHLNIIRNITRDTFELYYNKCLNYDEVLFTTNNCSKRFGFSSSLFESIEALYLFQLKKEYKEAHDFVESFACTSLENVNRYEFWDRFIPSLIGSFLITKDKLYLEKASQCAKIAITIDTEMDDIPHFYNFYKEIGKRNEFPSIHLPNEQTVDIPAILSLYKYTKDKEFLTRAENILINLDSTDKDPRAISKQLIGNEVKGDADGASISSLYHMVTAMNFLNNYYLYSELVLNMFFDYMKEDIQDVVMLSPMLEICNYADKIHFIYQYSPANLYNIVEQAYLTQYFSFSSLYFGPRMGFHFETSGLRGILRSAVKSKNTKDIRLIVNSLIMGLNQTHTLNGYSSQTYTNTRRREFTNIQDSSLFGEWLNLGAFIYSGKYKKIEKYIFNERGHIISK